MNEKELSNGKRMQEKKSMIGNKKENITKCLWKKQPDVTEKESEANRPFIQYSFFVT